MKGIWSFTFSFVSGRVSLGVVIYWFFGKGISECLLRRVWMRSYYILQLITPNCSSFMLYPLLFLLLIHETISEFGVFASCYKWRRVLIVLINIWMGQIPFLNLLFYFLLLVILHHSFLTICSTFIFLILIFVMIFVIVLKQSCELWFVDFVNCLFLN